jgi:DNA invertase Pin-like site-specific DNA recombinase
LRNFSPARDTYTLSASFNSLNCVTGWPNEREILKERVKAGIAQAKAKGKPMGRPQTAAKQGEKVRELHAQGLSQAEIARRLNIGRTSVRRLLALPPP